MKNNVTPERPSPSPSQRHWQNDPEKIIFEQLYILAELGDPQTRRGRGKANLPPFITRIVLDVNGVLLIGEFFLIYFLLVFLCISCSLGCFILGERKFVY